MTETELIRVVLADDHPIYREGLARTLMDSGIDVVAQAKDAGEALAAARAHHPDVLLLDLSMPGGGGLAVLAELQKDEAPPKTAILTASEEDDDVMAALRAGALGYILKGVGAGELVDLVRDIAGGRTYVSPGLAGRLLVALRRPVPAAARAADGPLSDLSKREEDILKLVAQGKSNREVGLALDLQEKTVKHYMTSILQKLQVRNRVEAAMLARTHLKG
jgi:two-component system, NarL family, nitrate/nitrite response regulator NarL